MLKSLLNKLAISKGNRSKSPLRDKRYKNNDILTRSPWALTLSWQDGYISKMAYRPSKLTWWDWRSFIVLIRVHP